MSTAGPEAKRSVDLGVPMSSPTSHSVARHAGLVGAIAALMLLVTAYVASQTASLRQQLVQRIGRVDRVSADAEAIQRRSDAPRSIREAEVSHADLLHQVNAAMRSAGLDGSRLVSTSSEPPRRTGNSPLSEVTQRLMFTALEIEPLAKFCYALCNADPSLHITAIQLRSGSGKTDWSADVSVSYWINAPLRSGP